MREAPGDWNVALIVTGWLAEAWAAGTLLDLGTTCRIEPHARRSGRASNAMHHPCRTNPN